MDGGGRCSLHPRDECNVSTEEVDLAVAGLPCQPFSMARFRGGSTAATGSTQDHPAFQTTQQFEMYIEVRRPKGFLIEQDDTFATQIDKSIGQSHLAAFAKKYASKGYAMRALIINHDVWVELPRNRVWILGLGPELGHAKAADWMVQHILEIQDRRKMLPPTKVFDIVNVDGADETLRRDRVKATGINNCVFLCCKLLDKTPMIQTYFVFKSHEFSSGPGVLIGPPVEVRCNGFLLLG